ncbi:MAG: tRNA (adenosine(37)-N6)-threonylcarbamoyltransferase complex ATPase subunit type 1 TsaE [Bacteroidales bacterium]|nr:tRNA (adenosine(37)-N6)-threonylcarbamoyltransferase complex ATPase subunit type 1 TsaE [Bacteroidales bacterium]MCF8388501.1 tRNA (adenosine(37)-N6)-threonylcarbamoyltransferase complex ATPase subunit type 1 TsaE [Bacteroidales bacterium]MCF8396738.1 tRNA (adenosine(37)-N6)-threonylcarbamoyltransferase complex ATPase subunit type 1 TsaE [Bacteroidales bacterium]
MGQEWICKSLAALDKIARELLEQNPGKRVFALHAVMGAGKTTFIKSLCRVLGVDENVSSPTFSLVNEYQTREGEAVYHFDFYRINKLEEAYDLGYEDYFYSGHYCFIEWPEKVEELLPGNCVYLKIVEIGKKGERSFTVVNQ